MRVSGSEFKRIRSLAAKKRAKRIDRIADNLALDVILAQTPAGKALAEAVGHPLPPKTSQDAPGRAWGSRDAGYAFGVPKRARKARNQRQMSQKLQIKAIKGRVLCSGGTWSQAVRRRDGRCLMCGSITSLQAHHWYYSRSRSVALSVEVSNGATLCYGCHIGKIHREASGAYADELKEKMRSVLPPGEIERMVEIFKRPCPLDLAFWQDAEQGLRKILGNSLSNRNRTIN
jgi:hypothetical protein